MVVADTATVTARMKEPRHRWGRCRGGNAGWSVSEKSRRPESERLVAGPFRVAALGAGDHLVVRAVLFHGLQTPANGVVIVLVRYPALAVAVDVHPFIAQVAATGRRGWGYGRIVRFGVDHGVNTPSSACLPRPAGPA